MDASDGWGQADGSHCLRTYSQRPAGYLAVVCASVIIRNYEDIKKAASPTRSLQLIRPMECYRNLNGAKLYPILRQEPNSYNFSGSATTGTLRSICGKDFCETSNGCLNVALPDKHSASRQRLQGTMAACIIRSESCSRINEWRTAICQ